MGILACALRPSGSTHGRPPCSSWLSLGDVVPMVPDRVTTTATTIAIVTSVDGMICQFMHF
jgi:hypothetical protein